MKNKIKNIFGSQRIKRLFLLLFVPLVALSAGLVVYLHSGRYVETDNAYVKANKIPISPEVSGAVKEVYVQENDEVSEHQPLFKLDPKPYQVALNKAEAQLGKVRTELSALKASFEEKQAEIDAATTRLTFAEKNQKRQQELATKHFVSASIIDESQKDVDLAKQEILALERDLERIKAMLNNSISAPVESHPNYLSAQAEVDQARLNLERVIIKAPSAGRINRPPQQGEYLTTGRTAMTLVAIKNLWIEANFTETDLTHINPGQPVTIHISTYPKKTWKGVVESLSPATGAEFSLIPPQNATGNWVRITQRLPVRIKLDSDSSPYQLMAGLSASVKIDTGHCQQLMGLALCKPPQQDHPTA